MHRSSINDYFKKSCRVFIFPIGYGQMWFKFIDQIRRPQWGSEEMTKYAECALASKNIAPRVLENDVISHRHRLYRLCRVEYEYILYREKKRSHAHSQANAFHYCVRMNAVCIHLKEVFVFDGKIIRLSQYSTKQIEFKRKTDEEEWNGMGLVKSDTWQEWPRFIKTILVQNI